MDGVFVPSAEKGFPQITSVGHVFEECPSTNNTSWGMVINTKYFKGNTKETVIETMRFSKVLFNSIEKLSQDALLMCPNQGITFDLDKIREVNPYGSINGFRSNCLFDTPVKDRPNPNIDIWVLVDGQIRYQKIGINRSGVMSPIQVEISDQDHFLSLIVTD